MKKALTLLCIFVFSFFARAAIQLPRIFSSNMVLQRDRPFTVWGWAGKGETVTVSFNGKQIKTKGDKNGEWRISFPSMAYGGPFQMVVEGKNRIVFDNILIGDIWICSGQSNMEWTLRNTKNAAKEIRESSHPSIRLFTVKQAAGFKPAKDVEGVWMECSSQTTPNFSAVAYFFGRKLNRDLNIPIGLVNTSWGGTNIQTWTSWDVMGGEEKYKNVNLDELQQKAAAMKEKQAQFLASLQNDKGDVQKWYEHPGDEGWKDIQQPGSWESSVIGNADGTVWFKKEFEIGADAAGKAAVLSLGPIDDNDVTYINGVKIGAVNSWNTDRVYSVPAGLLKAGKNNIVIKITDTGGGGGLYGKEDKLYLETGGRQIPLAGSWQYRPSALNTEFGVQDAGPNAFPSQLYNAMIAPLTPFAIKGAIWYQGEANTYEAYKYRSLFPQMIRDWRQHWGYDFPFFWAQLANFMKPDTLPSGSEWAELREAQTKTLSLPATGQAVLIDVGEADDIHPRNKQDVGYRLALAAEKVAYEKELVYSGPQYTSMQKEGNKIILQFSHTGSGLVVKDKYGYVKGFAIAGEDQKFLWAKGYVEGDKVIVYNDSIPNPVAVRYAWGDNPDDADLYNREGLPAVPFRTDEWKGKTEGNK